MLEASVVRGILQHFRLFSIILLGSFSSLLISTLIFREELAFFIYLPYFCYFSTFQLVVNQPFILFYLYLLLVPLNILFFGSLFSLSFFYFLTPFFRKSLSREAVFASFTLSLAISPILSFFGVAKLFSSFFYFLPVNYRLFDLIIDFRPENFFILFLTTYFLSCFFILLVSLFFLTPFTCVNFSTIRFFILPSLVLFALVFLPPDPVVHFFFLVILSSLLEILFLCKVLHHVYTTTGRVA